MEKFTEILKSNTINNSIYKNIPKDFRHIIFYGSSIKYIYALKLMEEMSKSKLAYEKKVIVNYDNTEYIYRMSDIHIEVNFEFLGCVAKNLWAAIYQNILSIAGQSPFYVVCRNFSTINNELMENFYTYMNGQNDNIHFVILTNNIGCLPIEIVNCSLVMPLKRYSTINNIEITHKFVEKITDLVIHKETSSIKNMRTLLYDLLIYQTDIYEIFYQVLKNINNHILITPEKMIKLLNEVKKILKLFNNNYRSIYHLENFIMTILEVV